MKPIIFDFPNSSPLGHKMREKMAAEEGRFNLKSFPDKESYLQILSPVKGREVIVNATLFHPNGWFLELLFLADTLKAQGAKKVRLVAPYLSYMRQDKVFHPGEALTSKTFAELLSTYFDSLITIDPHLHRYHNLSEIYSIPTKVLHAAPLISEWIHKHVKNAFLIGPDEESAQWVHKIGGNCPFIVLSKVRNKKGDVEISWPDVRGIEGKTPVFLDDIISSGVTMFKAIEHLKTLTDASPICIIIHPLFANDSYKKLQAIGVKEIISCNSIPHPSNQIDLSELIVSSLVF